MVQAVEESEEQGLEVIAGGEGFANGQPEATNGLRALGAVERASGAAVVAADEPAVVVDLVTVELNVAERVHATDLDSADAARFAGGFIRWSDLWRFGALAHTLQESCKRAATTTAPHNV